MKNFDSEFFNNFKRSKKDSIPILLHTKFLNSFLRENVKLKKKSSAQKIILNIHFTKKITEYINKVQRSINSLLTASKVFSSFESGSFVLENTMDVVSATVTEELID